MFKNYLKTACRNITREKGSTMINISGLTLGITCSIVLFLIVVHQSSFDNYHVNRDRIYRIVNQSDGNQGTQYQSGVPTVLPDAFRGDFPEAEAVVFTSYRSNSLVTLPQRNGETKKFREERGIVFTEPEFFKIFDRRVVMGTAAKSLDDPNEAIISLKLAKKYFGKEDVIGEIINFDKNEYKIAAVMKDAPDNTDFPFELMLSYSTIKKEREENGWNSIWSDEQCYFLIKEGVDIQSLERRIPAFTKKYLGENDFDKTEFHLQSLKDIHYDERYDVYSYNTVSKGMLIAFAVIALVLVGTASINFINLSTAEAIKRSKEVGVRKSLGSTRAQLVLQFLGETTLITGIAVIASVACTQLALRFVNPFLELQLTLDLVHNRSLWIYLLSVTIGVSLLSGLYPAFVISGFKPARVLKNQMTNKGSSSYLLRRVLVVLQFFISQLLIILTLVIIYQMDYSGKKHLGFGKEAILVVPIPEHEVRGLGNSGLSKMRRLRDEMSTVPGVERVSLSSAPPSSGNVSGTNFKIEGIAEEYGTQVKQIDGNYLDLYRLELLAGQNVKDIDTATGFVVNEKLARIAGFSDPKEILGRSLTVWRKTFPVVGIVKDFHTVSLRQPIEATVLFNRMSGFETMALKIDMRRSKEIIAQLKTKWEATYPQHLFDFDFLDETIRRFYDGERKMAILLSSFTSMAIFIGCLGLFGLATFMANQKTKEIGVRKVMGASVESIVVMFSKEYLKLIIIGFLFAAPVAWLAMNAFLGEFAYKIDIGPGIFLSGLGVTLFLAMATVGYKSFRAAIANPVHSLRYE